MSRPARASKPADREGPRQRRRAERAGPARSEQLAAVLPGTARPRTRGRACTSRHPRAQQRLADEEPDQPERDRSPCRRSAAPSPTPIARPAARPRGCRGTAARSRVVQQEGQRFRQRSARCDRPRPSSANPVTSTPRIAPAISFAATTRPRTGVTSNVWAIVPCVDSPAASTIPTMSAKIAPTRGDLRDRRCRLEFLQRRTLIRQDRRRDHQRRSATIRSPSQRKSRVVRSFTSSARIRPITRPLRGQPQEHFLERRPLGAKLVQDDPGRGGNLPHPLRRRRVSQLAGRPDGRLDAASASSRRSRCLGRSRPRFRRRRGPSASRAAPARPAARDG